MLTHVIPKFLKMKKHVNVISTYCASWAVFVLISMKLSSSMKSLLYDSQITGIKKLFKLFYLHCFSEKVVEKSNKENLKVIKNTLPNKSGNPERLKK